MTVVRGCLQGRIGSPTVAGSRGAAARRAASGRAPSACAFHRRRVEPGRPAACQALSSHVRSLSGQAPFCLKLCGKAAATRRASGKQPASTLIHIGAERLPPSPNRSRSIMAADNHPRALGRPAPP